MAEDKIVLELNEFLEDEDIQALVKEGYRISQDLGVALKLTGIASTESKFILVNKSLTSAYARIKLDTSKIIASYQIDLMKIALKLGYDTIHIVKGDYPCILTKGYDKSTDGIVEAILIAPRIIEGRV